MIFGQNHFRVKMNEEPSAETPNDGGVEGVETPAPKDWSKDPRVDGNGNPIEGQPAPDVKPEPTKEVVQHKPEEHPEPKKTELDTPVVKQIQNLVEESGLDAKAVRKAIEDNDGKVTPELAKALKDKHGELVANLVTEKLEGFHTEAKEKLATQQTAVYSQVEDAFKESTTQSGKESWDQLAGWAKENVPTSERNEINQLLAKGGLTAKLAVAELISRFKDSNAYSQPAKLVGGDSSSNSGGVQPLSRTEYTNELRKLEAKGHVYGQSQEMAKLDARRQAGLRQGI